MFDAKAYKRAWYQKNKEAIKAKRILYVQQNREKVNAGIRRWTEKNRPRSNAIKRAWAARNPSKDRECKISYEKAHPENRKGASARRRARRLKARPAWLSLQQRRQITSIYRRCPIGFEVDHIVPLQGKNVSGLHVPWNLQYLSVSANRAKRNNYE